MYIKSSDKCVSHHRCRSQKKAVASFIGLGKDVVRVLEVIELLRQLKSVLGRVGGLRCRDALLDQVGELSGAKPELPKLIFVQKPQVDIARQNFFCVQTSFAKDVAGAHDGVLRVQPRLTFEAQRFFAVEGNYRTLGDFEHEVT